MQDTQASPYNGPQWEINGDELLVSSEEELYHLSANDIYEAVFEGKALTTKGLKFEDLENPEAIQFSRFPVDPYLTIEQKPDSTLSCDCRVDHEGHTVPVVNFNNRKADHVLIRNTWYPFTPGALENIQNLAKSAGIQTPEKLRLREFLSLKSASLTVDDIKDLATTKNVLQELKYQHEETPPPLFNGKLYPYQLDGWKWLSFLCKEGIGCILADEMGLGKTVQLIALLSDPDRASVSPSLIISPSTILENWRREIEKFSPRITTLVHQGPNRTGLPAALKKYDVVITSYDTAVGDGSLFAMIDWQVVILDEAQNIKNPETRRAKSIKKLKRNIGIAVTGTPVENRLRDLWSLLDFCLPDYLGEEKDFINRFEKNDMGAQLLEPYVTPLMLRRRVAQVAKDLPPKIEIPQILSLTQSEIQNYEQIRLQTLDEYGENASLVALNKLRMFCAHPSLVSGEAFTGDPADFAKFQRLLEISEEVFSNNEKLIVFTSYNEMIQKIVHEMNRRYGVYSNFINGDTPIEERQKIVDEFSSVGGEGSILALNPRAAGVGLNITAATHVIHYNLEWNPAIEDQASARAYRRGQSRPVTVHRLFIADTVEELVNERLERKRHLSETAVVGVQGKEDDLKDIVNALHISPVRGSNET